MFACHRTATSAASSTASSEASSAVRGEARGAASSAASSAARSATRSSAGAVLVWHAVRQVRPWAVDVSSGVEAAKGVKDPQRILDFIAGVRDADA